MDPSKNITELVFPSNKTPLFRSKLTVQLSKLARMSNKHDDNDLLVISVLFWAHSGNGLLFFLL